MRSRICQFRRQGGHYLQKNEQAAIDIANEIDADVKIYQLDNSDSKSVDNTFKKVIKDHGSINTLVNAA